MPKLKAEEELLLRAAAAHPHLDPADQRMLIRELVERAGHTVPAKKATHADLRSIGITVREK